MSFAQILKVIPTLSDADIESLWNAIQLEKLRRAGVVASPEETRLLRIVNQPMTQTQRFKTLTEKWQDEGLSETERVELLAIVTEREEQNAQRVEAMAHLSELRGVPFQTLWKQMVGGVPVPLVPNN